MMSAKHQHVLDQLRESGVLTDELAAELVSGIEAYNEAFAAEHEPAASVPG